MAEFRRWMTEQGNADIAARYMRHVGFDDPRDALANLALDDDDFLRAELEHERAEAERAMF